MIFTTIQGILALFTSAILVLQLLIGFFIGADSDIDVDGDASGDFDMSTIFSPKGILQFICGSSWYLVLIGVITGVIHALAEAIIVAFWFKSSSISNTFLIGAPIFLLHHAFDFTMAVLVYTALSKAKLVKKL